MDATVSIHLASIYSSRIAGHRLRTSQCIRIRAASELVHPGYRVGDQLWTDIHVNVSGAETDLHLRLLTTPQHLGGERRWFACPKCGRRTRCLYAPWLTEPFWCRRCHHLLYDSQFARRDDDIGYANAFMRLDRLGQRLERREKNRARPRVAPKKFWPKPLPPRSSA